MLSCKHLLQKYSNFQKLKQKFFFDYANLEDNGVLNNELLELRQCIRSINEMLSPWNWKRFDPRYRKSIEKKKNYKPFMDFKIDEAHSDIEFLTVSPCNKILGQTNRGYVYILELNTSEKWVRSKIHAPAESIKTLPDGGIMMVGSGNYIVSLLTRNKYDDLEFKTLLPEQIAFHFSCCTVMPDGEIIIGRNNGSIQLVQGVLSGTWAHRKSELSLHGIERPGLHLPSKIIKIEACPDGKIIVLLNDGSIYVLTKDVTGQLTSEKIKNNGEDSFYSMCTLITGEVVTGDWDGKICIWSNDSSGQWSSKNFSVHDKRVTLEAMPDGRFFSGGSDGFIYEWKYNLNIKEWRCQSIASLQGEIKDMKVLPNGVIVIGTRRNYLPHIVLLDGEIDE